MHAIRLHSFGQAENLRYEQVPDPEPGPGQVRIRVEANGVHLVDTALRRGEAGPFPLPELPTVPGREVAGIVDRVGEGVDEALVGQPVVAHLGNAPGGYAELTVVDAAQALSRPGLSAADAVALAGTGRTMLGIAQFADLGPGSVAAVTSAAGGIGTLLVQYAKSLGATVIGIAGGANKAALVAANGADLAVDYTEPEWVEKVRAHLAGRPATVVFDGVGGAVGTAAVGLLAPGGQHLIYGWSAGSATEVDPGAGIASETVLGPKMVEKAGGDLRILARRALALGIEGVLRPAITAFPLSAAAAAHVALESGATTGKVVLVP
ncbi:zinc-binding dehydrogenase [Nocardia camponoti]|uniref:Oxidoreductase n=1 Tax=Nocardia camponoti TaxID=1616106 RepID=A0A917Q9W0_9NOCA|nr:zinc-binding dehydrogenase [Nocardia camponoti]GGK38133.1 oxidoreductase [Nocardia camponoti]